MRLLRLPKLRFRLIVAEEYQPVAVVPWWLWLCLAAALAGQIWLRSSQAKALPDPVDLETPPSAVLLRAAAFGDEITLAKVLTLWLQAFDNQPGVSISFKNLNYRALRLWLEEILALDPRAQYPLFNAIRLYGAIKGDPERAKIMLDFVRQKFAEDPVGRWQWMASAVTILKVNVKDIDLALAYADELRALTPSDGSVPNWARQMKAFILAELNEYEASAKLLFNLIESGEVTDPQEFLFLLDRLEQIILKMIEAGQVKTQDELQRMEDNLDRLRELYLKSQAASQRA